MSELDLTEAVKAGRAAVGATTIFGQSVAATVRQIVEAAAPAIVQAERARAKEEDKNWDEAVDWLLNSRYVGDPDAQAAFNLLAAGGCTWDEATSGYMADGRTVLEAHNAADSGTTRAEADSGYKAALLHQQPVLDWRAAEIAGAPYANRWAHPDLPAQGEDPNGGVKL